MKQSIGQRLKHAREERRITLEKASESTRIRVVYLRALEADDHSSLPSPVQARGFLRNYADYLGLNFDALINELRAEQKSTDEIIGPADATPQQPASTSELSTSQDSTPHTSTGPASTPQADSPSKRRGRNKPEPQPTEPQPETTAEPISPAEPSQPNISDTIWQTWLNRLDSRKKDDPAASSTAEPDNSPIPDEPRESQTLQTESVQILREIGSTLHHRRELLSLHLDEVERNTKIKAHYLEALENGELENLPSTVQTRGMLSNYASFLDLDVDALLLRYADALQARFKEKTPQKPGRKPGQPIIANMPPLRSFIAGDMIFGIGVAILLIGFSVWGINRVMTIQSQQEVQPTAPSISDVLLATPESSSFAPPSALIPADALAEATQTVVIPTQNLSVNVQVNLIAVERTFMRVVVDGQEVFNGRTVPGTAYLFEAEEQIEILVGSGAAIRVVYNGRDLGLMGGLGQVVSVIYTADEIITPTALPTATPTNTVPATATVPPTLTPVPTSTPRP
jgi:cytoskeletal protein RodZ